MQQVFPSLSVLIPNYNHGHLIGDQLRAIFSQSVQPDQVVIVDDASTDDSVRRIQELIAGRERVKLICKSKNSGVVTLVNEFVREAKTDYITVLAADDIILPGHFEQSLGLLGKHPNAGLCSAVSYTESDQGSYATPGRASFPTDIPEYLDPARILSLLLRREDWFMGDTIILRRAALIAEGLFDPALLSYADGFLYRVLALRNGACFIPRTLAINRVFGTGYSSSTTRDEQKLEKILVLTSEHMRTTYAALFPADLVARSNARMLFRLMCLRVDGFWARTLANLEQIKPLAGGRAIKNLSGYASFASKIVLFALLRIYDLPGVVRARLVREAPCRPQLPES